MRRILVDHARAHAAAKRNPAANRAVPRDEIKTLTMAELSMMPEGLLAPLSDQEVRDLIAYLRSPAQVPLPATVP